MSDPKAQRSFFGPLGDLARIFGEDRVLGAAGQVLETVARTKATVDDKVASLLGLANLPSRSEVDKLRCQVEVLQASVAVLTRKLNRLVEDTGDKAAPHPGGRCGRLVPGGFQPRAKKISTDARSPDRPGGGPRRGLGPGLSNAVCRRRRATVPTAIRLPIPPPPACNRARASGLCRAGLCTRLWRRADRHGKPRCRAVERRLPPPSNGPR